MELLELLKKARELWMALKAKWKTITIVIALILIYLIIT